MCKESQERDGLGGPLQQPTEQGDLIVYIVSSEHLGKWKACPTLQFDFPVWICLHCSGICLLIYFIILKLIAVLIVSFWVSTQDISFVAGMLNFLVRSENVSHTSGIRPLDRYSYPFIHLWTIWEIQLTLMYELRFAFELVAAIRGSLDRVIRVRCYVG